MDLLKHDNLLGLGSFKFDFTASGASQAAIMSSMDGSGGFDLADGALKGVNIVKIARAVAEFQDGFNPAALQNAVAAARGPDEMTDFSEFLSNFTINNGLVNAPVISLSGPYLTMTGKGTVNLPNQTIDLRLAPRATTTSDGEGGRIIAVPIKIGGSFANPTIGVDAESLVRSSAEKGLRGLVEQIGRAPRRAMRRRRKKKIRPRPCCGASLAAPMTIAILARRRRMAGRAKRQLKKPSPMKRSTPFLARRKKAISRRMKALTTRIKRNQNPKVKPPPE